MAASFCRRSFLNYKNCLFQTQKRTGYVVLIPEAPEEVGNFAIDNLENLPDFTKLSSSQCKNLVNSLSQQYEIGFWELEQNVKNENSSPLQIFKHFIEPLEVLTIPFLTSWGIFGCFHYTNKEKLSVPLFNSLQYRILQVRNNKFNSKILYDFCKKALKEEGDTLTDEQKRLLEKFIWEGVIKGLELNAKEQDFLIKTSTVLNNYTKIYNDKMLYAKSMFRHVIEDKKFAEETPLDLLRNSSLNHQSPLEGPWIITLRNCVYSRYLEYCSNREARKHIWLNYNQLLSKRSKYRFNANYEISCIRKERRAYAKLLGYPSYVHLTMNNRMAGSLENVQGVLSELLESAKNSQEKEIHELEKFAYENDFRDTMEFWDFPYWKRLHLKHCFGIDEMTLRDYFPLSQVLLGLIALCEQLFGIIIEEVPSAECWDTNVRYFRVSDEKSKTLLGGFYLDPYATPKKLVGELDIGEFITIRPKSKICNSLPLSALFFNFSPPEDGKPSLLYFREVIQLFEKFGLMLQHTLTDTTYSEVSGSSNIEWDAVSAVKNFLKFWLSEKGTLESISGHYETGEPIPSQILDNLCNIHRHMAGVRVSNAIYLSNLDLELHLQDASWLPIVQDLWPKHLLFSLFDLDHHVCGFQDIISGPWGGCYYSDIWSNVVAADIFTAFKEAGFDNHEEMNSLGRRFRSTFLMSGGSCNTNEIFRRFRGRDLEPKCFINYFNLNGNNAPFLEPNPNLVLA